MSDRDALLAAIRAQPDEDTPRLVYADWLDENDRPERAAFIRAQVELARTPPWEPFAVRCRWHAPEVVSGKRFITDLPPGHGSLVTWADRPFRRGFGWELEVRTISLWSELVEPLFDREPIGSVGFWGGTLDAWNRIAASDRVRCFRELAFHTSPIEPLRVLRDEPAACGVTDIHFRRASGAGMPVVLEDLLAAPLGRAVRGLHFHTGYESLNEQIEALHTRDSLDRLSFSVMGFTAGHVRRLFDGPAGAALTELHFRHEPLGGDGLKALADGVPGTLRDLALVGVGVKADGLEALVRSDRLTELRRLNLSGNPLKPRAVKVLSLSRPLTGLRSLDLLGCRIGDKGARHVVAAKFWPNLVELDLRYNEISAAGVKYLLDAPRAPDLAALVLTGDALGSDARTALTKKYGAAVLFVPTEGPGG
jgi:uncharacterized protein (TIGR02996 family)